MIKENAPVGATHYEISNEEVFYYAKDMIGRWCCIDGDGDAWPCHSVDHERYDNELKPL